MAFLETQEQGIANIYYEDFGTGQPVILIHGWPLSGKAWEHQQRKIIDAGFRCITYDRRGFGQSERVWGPYDYSALAGDLHRLIEDLDLKDCIIVGFSMGGGEVVRYFTDYGSDRIAKAALISSIIPLVAKKDDNPDGVPQEGLDEIMEALHNDRPGFLKGFLKGFYNFDQLGDRISKGQLDYDFCIASNASAQATIKCAEAWAGTDFRDELKNVDVPTLIVHGDNDQIVPLETSAKQAAEGISDNQYEVVYGAPHGLTITHKDELDEILLPFLKG